MNLSKLVIQDKSGERGDMPSFYIFLMSCGFCLHILS